MADLTWDKAACRNGNRVGTQWHRGNQEKQNERQGQFGLGESRGRQDRGARMADVYTSIFCCDLIGVKDRKVFFVEFKPKGRSTVCKLFILKNI